MAHELIPFEQGFEIEGPRGPSWLIDADGLVYIRCACGFIIGSPKLHEILEDGTVNASVKHAEDDRRAACTWHTFVRLACWVDGKLEHGSNKLAPRKHDHELLAGRGG